MRGLRTVFPLATRRVTVPLEGEPTMAWTFEKKCEAAFRAPIGRELHRPDTRVEDRAGWYRIDTPSTHGFLNQVYLSALDERESEEAIDRVVAEHTASRRPLRWSI